MQGKPEVIAIFKAALPAEAQLNLQYRMNTRLLGFQGIDKAADKFSEFADKEHCFLKKAVKQLLFLSGDNQATASYAPGPVVEPASVTAMLEGSLAMEMAICGAYEIGIEASTKAHDDESRNLLEHLIKWHHDTVRWLEKKLRNVKKYGEDQVILAGKL